MTGAEKYDVIRLDLFEDVGLGIAVELVISSMMSLWNENKNGNEE